MAAFNGSTVNLSGGEIGGDLYAFHGSTVNVFGTGFNFADGDYSDNSLLHGKTLTGFLADGTPISNPVWIYSSSAKVTLATTAVPEPSSLVLLGIGTAGLFSRVRRRKKSAA